MRLFITGSASHLARACLPLLCADTRVSRVVGIDLLPPVFFHPKYQHWRCDMRSAEIGKLMQGSDALIHFAWRVLRGKLSAQEMQDMNVRGTKHVFDSAAAVIPRLIHFSSAAVYGGGEHLRESASRRPLPNFLYAHHKLEIEHYLAQALPHALCLRPHIILGPHCQPLLKRLLAWPVYPAYAHPQAQFQCVHEDDVARALQSALFNTSVGFFNLASDDSFSFKAAIVQRHAHAIALPFSLAQTAFNVAWHITGWGGEPSWLAGMRNTLTLDCSRARDELQWQPAYSSADALASV